jgi:CRP-like cAMP-binding protein/cytochrome c-type biogenesis protein CcmH/NrfG
MSERSIPPDDVEQIVALAARFAERERFEDAADLYLLALRLDPKNVGVKLGLADVRKRQRQNRGGASPRGLRALVGEQLRRASIDSAHFLGLAHIYAEKGENARAVECLEVATAKDPANPGTYKLLGRILFRRKSWQAAAEELEKALLYNPFDREVAELLGRACYEYRDLEAGLRASVHAFLLLHEGDREGTARLRRRIRTLRQILGWGRRELTRTFHERQEHLHTAFDRLEWQRERFMEEEGMAPEALPQAPRTAAPGSGQIDLAARLRRLPLWSNLTDEQVFMLTGAVHEETHDTGSLLFAYRDQGRDLYLLEEGRVAVERPTHYGTFTLGEIPPGGLLGEVNFITLRERSADALVSAPSRLLRIDADELDRLCEADPDLAVQLYWCFWRSLARKLRATNEQLREFFTGETPAENVIALRRTGEAGGTEQRVTVEPSDKIRLFREQGLSRTELMTLATFSTEKRFDDGAYLFQEGDEGGEMYVVLEGRARISKFIPGGGEEALAILDRGDFFGEMSLIDGEPRSADARAHGGPLTVLALDQLTVQEVLSMDSQASLEFLQLLCRLISHRLREIDEKVIGWRILAGAPGGGAESRTA